jgi:glycosyltransferase involved in cell wall biosynthesis
MNSENRARIPILLMARELGVGGTERQLVETARCLKDTCFIPHVGCFRPDGLRRQDLVDSGIPILHLPVQSFVSMSVIRAASQLRRYIHENGIQVVHSFDAPLNIFGAPAARIAGTPAVITSQRGHRDLTRSRAKWLLRITDRIADAVVVNCEAMKRYLVDEESVPEAKVRLCYNAVDIERYRRRPPVSTPDGRVVIGTVCALRPEKAIDVLIHAFASIAGGKAKLVIVGSGPEESTLRALCTRLGCDRDTQFVPASAEVVEWLSQIDIFVLPSRFEALSNALMEAMACGCCPVASRIGGNPELVQHNRTGLLFEVDNVQQLAVELQSLLEDEARRREFAAAAVQKMSQFTYARAAGTLQSIYESVLNPAGQWIQRSRSDSE